eukprot:6721460-Prymnesium_polylepis.1
MGHVDEVRIDHRIGRIRRKTDDIRARGLVVDSAGKLERDLMICVNCAAVLSGQLLSSIARAMLLLHKPNVGPWDYHAAGECDKRQHLV